MPSLISAKTGLSPSSLDSVLSEFRSSLGNDDIKILS